MTQVDWRIRFPQMTPVSAAPWLFRINGCGVGLYGRRDADAETGSYVATQCLSLLFVPLMCLRAFRVAPAPEGGWYFLGREPLSTFAKGWNLALLASLALIVGLTGYASYTGTPEYQARQQMAAAAALVGQGQLAQGAEIYQRLATAGAQESARATQALRNLVETGCEKAPLAEAAGVLTAAARIGQREGALSRADLAARGLDLAAARGAADPPGGVKVLAAIRPLAVDTRKVDQARRPLLQQWVAAEPGNLEAVCGLAELLTAENQLAEAKKLLAPLQDQVGNGEGARVLGTILARQGDYDGAYALLWPYVKSRLDPLRTAEAQAEQTLQRLWDREVQLLREDKGPAELYTRLHNAPEEEKGALVREYVNGRLKTNRDVLRTQEALERASAVVPVTLELGIVMLHRAQGLADAAARQKQLQATEEVFLAIRGTAGESDEYRLYLGQVYYWLGKQAEGKKLFDELLQAKGRSTRALLEIAHRLRDLGAESEARALTEEAYTRAGSAEDRFAAAQVRALLHKDLEDEVAWLRKANTAEPLVKARLAHTLGRQAHQQGQDDEAVRQYRVAIEAYAAMPRSAWTLNDTGAVYYSILTITGERDAMERCLDCIEQAVALEPRDPILLGNAAALVLNVTLTDLLGQELDLRALRETGSFTLLRFLYHDQAGRDAWMQRVQAHPGIARALAYLDKVMVLAPRRVTAYVETLEVQDFLRNEVALAALAERIKAADVDTSDQLQQLLEVASGSKDAKYQGIVAAAAQRGAAVRQAVAAKGGPTAAVALAQQAAQQLALDEYTGTADPAAVVKLAEEAHRLAPSTATAANLQAAYLWRAEKELRRSEPAFESLCQRCGRIWRGGGMRIALALGAPGPLAQKVQAHPDVQRAVALVVAEGKAFPNSGSGSDWALVKTTNPAEAERIVAVLQKNTRLKLGQAIGRMLAPYSPPGALEAYWSLQARGEPQAAQELLRQLAQAGVPLPLQP